MSGYNAGKLSALYGAPEPSGVSVPPEYMGGPRASADGFSQAANDYTLGYRKGWHIVSLTGKHGVAAG